MSRTVEVRPGVYHDSVTLMQLSRSLLDDEAVSHAQVSMGTELNLDLLAEHGYDRPAAGAGDLVIAIDADDGAVDRIRGLVDQLLTASTRHRPGERADDPAPRTVRTAVAGGASVVLISVPGEHAFRQAMEAVEAGAHPILFSDNVTVEHEVLVKRRAKEAGLLAMGPDCGTVILDGVGLGFANVVAPGPIGLVSASGTGAQQVCALADHAGVGVRHVIGLGGRDLTDDVGGLAAIPAVRLLDADPAVEVIGVIAKTIGREAGAALEELRDELATPMVTVPVDDLTGGTAALLDALGVTLPPPPTWRSPSERPRRSGPVLGLYSGGTLAAEAEQILAGLGVEATVVDLGDDEYTRGRPHPMIDARLRLALLGELGGDEPSEPVGAVLVDVVLGHGAAADPASELAPVLAQLAVPVYVALIGTSDDPQGRDRQAELLASAGASVYLSNAEAARAAAEAVT